MRLNPKALASTTALLWGGAVCFAGVAHLIWPGYGGAFLDIAASIYPGYHVGGLGTVIVGTLYGLVDGFAGGLVAAWIYNAFNGSMTPGEAMPR